MTPRPHAPRSLPAMHRLRDALDQLRNAERMIDHILRTDFPPGTRVQFHDRGIVYPAVVTMNCYGDRIKIRNEHTGKERFIDAMRLNGAT